MGKIKIGLRNKDEIIVQLIQCQEIKIEKKDNESNRFFNSYINGWINCLMWILGFNIISPTRDQLDEVAEKNNGIEEESDRMYEPQDDEINMDKL